MKVKSPNLKRSNMSKPKEARQPVIVIVMMKRKETNEAERGARDPRTFQQETNPYHVLMNCYELSH